MAIYHLSVKLITRGAGRSATAAIAYRAAERVPDERTGLVFDYSRKRGVEHTEVVLPSAVAEAAGWARDRVRLWNAAEAAENRKDSRVAREYEVALPRELAAAERLQLVRDFAREIAERHGCAIDFAIHAPHRDGDVRNHHAHVLATTRCVGRDGLGAKTDIELKDTDRAKRGLCSGRQEVTAIRERWAALVNEHLAERGHDARVDHRSLAAQGEVREPTTHKGPAVTAIERRQERSFVAERTREEVIERLRAAAELGRLERESKALDQAIIDTSTDLKATIAARDAGRAASWRESAHEPKPGLADIRRDAQTLWLAQLAERGRAERQSQLRDAVPALDLSGDVASAARSRTIPVETVTRDQARAAWLSDRAEHATESREVAKPAPGNETPREDDHAL